VKGLEKKVKVVKATELKQADCCMYYFIKAYSEYVNLQRKGI